MIRRPPVAWPNVVLAYIIRRLINMVITLLVVTAVTFGIFFVVPKLTGTDPAFLYTGKTSDAASVEGIRVKMGLNDPVIVQYGKFLKALVVGRDYANGPDVHALLGALPRLLVQDRPGGHPAAVRATHRSPSRWRSAPPSSGCSSASPSGCSPRYEEVRSSTGQQ